MAEKKVTLDMGLHVYRQIAHFLEPFGFNVAIYGGVAKNGIGTDLDILAVPIRRVTNDDIARIGMQMVEKFSSNITFDRKIEPYKGMMDTYTINFSMGQVQVDLVMYGFQQPDIREYSGKM